MSNANDMTSPDYWRALATENVRGGLALEKELNLLHDENMMSAELFEEYTLDLRATIEGYYADAEWQYDRATEIEEANV